MRAKSGNNTVNLKLRMGSAAFAYRGYNVTNLGKSPELLAHKIYGPIVRKALQEASEVCADILKRPVNLIERVEQRLPSSLDTFADDAGMIVAIEIAQIRVLEEIFEVPVRQARVAMGYSLGELPALDLAGVFKINDLSPILLELSNDCAELARNVSMGVLFTRGQSIELADVRRLCLRISAEDKGLIAPSTQLAPNAVLLLGEHDTIDRFQAAMIDFFPERMILRRNQHKWPPLHTPILWQRNISNRTALRLARLPGGFQAPAPTVISCVTGKADYNDYNARDILTQWVDHPQLLWDALYETMNSGVDLIVHVGPEPNMIPDTLNRIATNVKSQVGANFFARVGRRVMTSMARRAWLTPLLSSKAAILRAPFIEHVILEDWLLAQSFD